MPFGTLGTTVDLPFMKKVLLALILPIAACNPDRVERLSGDCTFMDEGFNTRTIYCDYAPPTQNITSIVFDYDYNDEYIIALQKPDTGALYEAILEGLRFENCVDTNKSSKYGYDVDCYEKMKVRASQILYCDSVYLKTISRRFNYWIRINRTKTLLGPLTFDEYVNLRRELDIPKRLKLDSTLVEQFRR
jgi:hypothetical protein